MTDAAPGSLGGELYEHLCRTYADAQPGSRWIMNREWLIECRKMDTGSGPLWSPGHVAVPTALLGLPIEVREDGGAPHLVAD